MTIPEDFTKSVCDSLALTIKELHDLPHITHKQLLNQELMRLGNALSKCAHESWTVKEANLTLGSLDNALQKASSLASKWKKKRIRLLLDKSTFIDELSDAVMEIQKSCGNLEARQNHRGAAKAIREQLGNVVQGLRNGSELNVAETQFKKEILDFLRLNHSKLRALEDAMSLVNWLAKHLDTDVDSIEQDLQEIKENAGTFLNAQRDMGTELLEQLLLSLSALEKQSVVLASTKAKLVCGVCRAQMICPVMIDSGLSFCKACIEERFRCGSMTCPETHLKVNKPLTVNLTLQNVVAGFGEVEEQPAAETFSEDGESSDTSFRGEPSDPPIADESLEMKALQGLEWLDAPLRVRVLRGFVLLIKCAASPGGRLAVFNAKYSRPTAPTAPPIEVIPMVIEKAKTLDSEYSYLAVKLLAALTSSEGVASQNWSEPDSGIILEDAALDFIVSLTKEEGFAKPRLLAAETLCNILVNKEVRKEIRCKEGIVPSLVALANAELEPDSTKEIKKASALGLKGLQRLAKCFTGGVRAKQIVSARAEQIVSARAKQIVSALIKLLKKGLSYQPEMTVLVRDSLVALGDQVRSKDPRMSTSEACKVVWKERMHLMAIKGSSISHTTVPGRLAIIAVVWKLCRLYKEGIDEHVILYCLRMIKYTRSEMVNLSGPSSQSLLPREGSEAKKLNELVNQTVRLLCFCVTHGKSTAQSALIKNDEEGRILEELLLAHGETSGISDKSRLEILSVLEQIGIVNTQTISMLVKISVSKDLSCRQQVARRLQMLVAGEHLTELKQAGGIAALLSLLEDQDCIKDALVALHALPPSMALPIDQLPLESILDFLSQEGLSDAASAAIGLLDSMVKGKAVVADKFLESEGALEAVLKFLDVDSDSPGSQKSASALLEMAKNQSVRRRIAAPGLRGLSILVKYVRDHGCTEVKELLTATLVLFCRDGETEQDAVIEADGHRYLLTALQKRILKEEAARGLLELVKNTRTTEIILDSGYVATAMGSIDGRFACIDIALGLSQVSSLPEGLKQIYSDPSSVSALLILLEHCSDRSGKKAAALVLSRLYPRLHQDARRERITQKCQLLLNYLAPFDPRHVKEFLQALAALAAEPDGRRMIHQTHGHEILIDHLSEMDTEIQDLVLKIFSEMSSDVSDNGVDTHDIRMLRVAFMDIRVGEKVFHLMRSNEFLRRTDSMEAALVLIGNLSLAGSYAPKQLVDEGALLVLVDILKRYERFLPVVVELALKALGKVLDDPGGRVALSRGEGIRTLVAILKVDALETSSDAFRRVGQAFGRASGATAILKAIVKDPHSRKYAMDVILEGDILSELSKIIFYGEPGRVKHQAAALMKLLAKYGPSRVCGDFKEKRCLDALNFLRTRPDCNAIAVDVLNYVSGQSRSCRRYIHDNLSSVSLGPE